MQKKLWLGKRVGIITVVAKSGETGGAERFYEGLRSGFEAIGCKPSLIEFPADEPDFQTILENYGHCEKLDVSDFDFVISTKVPSYAISHTRHVLYLVHTVRVFDDMFEEAFGEPTEELYRQRAQLHKLDLAALLGAKARFAIGHEVAQRLYKWRGLNCDVLHPPLTLNNFKNAPARDYFFLAGRLHEWKRVNLIIQAIKSSTLPMRFLVAGDGPTAQELHHLARGDPRIKFLGRVDDQHLIDLYSKCLAVPFVPIREDYGYITLEAFASGKPVVTCSDSGEPCYFVRPYKTGLIADPNSNSIREKLEWLWHHRQDAVKMGQNGRELVSTMSWARTAQTLAEAAFQTTSHSWDKKTKVTVLDMQPIDPPVGGGRLRLLGLYHNLGSNNECTYIGTYDWAGEAYRDHMLSDHLREITVPLSDEHHAAASKLSSQAGGKVVIDLAFSQQVHLSPEFIETTLQYIEDAEVVVFSHPWLYPLVKDRLRPRQIIIYDSHNVEGYLRAQLLDESNPVEAQLLRQVVEDENALGSAADWILTCSHEDLVRFNRLYGFDPGKMRVVPNGVMAFRDPLPSPELKQESRRRLGLRTSDFVAIFIGSPYGPNVEAAQFIEGELADSCPDVTFVVAGGVGQVLNTRKKNVIVTGQIDEPTKSAWLYVADIAINPMISGSGTNIKMFDFMAMGLPVVSTAIGARGIDQGGRHAILQVAAEVDAFRSAIGELSDSGKRSAMAREARLIVEEGYSWERISHQLGHLFCNRADLARQKRPFFSVVIPTYERHQELTILLTCLRDQVERDFEVIFVDQSESLWQNSEQDFGFPLRYFHSPVKGAVRARNTGAQLAQGEIIAFIDDDCRPESEWLAHARKYFDDPANVGLEGLIYSDHDDDENWRPVTNIGFEGFGFMTANLFVRSSAFQFIGGFDLAFDRPHFREDTDLGWRLLKMGSIPYAADVRVFHPAQPRSKERESASERGKFFVKDALLYKKHTDRYRALFFRECHYSKTGGFIENVRAGFRANSIEVPEWMEDVFEDYQ